VAQDDSAKTMHQGNNEQSSKYKVIANLPYQITSPVIRLFLEQTNQPERMVCMVQKEVGERICAKPGELSLLAIAVQVYGKPEYVTTIPRSYFWPSPQVDSAIIKITPHPSLLVSPLKLDYFFKLVKVGFANRRKVLFNNLLPVVNKNKLVLGQAFEQIGLDQKVRAQELSVTQWMRLAELVSSNG
jgi:16S rRNA (adenine1518-N6/adenine1519-N6)-dimethyltransferase